MVNILLTIDVSVPDITILTPLMSLFIRVIISPCFSLVKNECDICCKWSYISFRMRSKAVRQESSDFGASAFLISVSASEKPMARAARPLP